MGADHNDGVKSGTILLSIQTSSPESAWKARKTLTEYRLTDVFSANY
jgi:hypothetical protein